MMRSRAAPSISLPSLPRANRNEDRRGRGGLRPKRAEGPGRRSCRHRAPGPSARPCAPRSRHDQRVMRMPRQQLHRLSDRLLDELVHLYLLTHEPVHREDRRSSRSWTGAPGWRGWASCSPALRPATPRTCRDSSSIRTWTSTGGPVRTRGIRRSASCWPRWPRPESTSGTAGRRRLRQRRRLAPDPAVPGERPYGAPPAPVAVRRRAWTTASARGAGAAGLVGCLWSSKSRLSAWPGAIGVPAAGDDRQPCRYA
jgi:hypothetical protein